MMYDLVTNEGAFLVVEVASGLVVKTTRNRKVAVSTSNSLNKGGGFQGHTPPFFVTGIPQPTT